MDHSSAYATSYPDSTPSSPRSRDLESAGTWDDQQPTATIVPSKAKLMCSYNGKIQPRTHDNKLAYTGGETKILAVDRGIGFNGMIGRLSAFCEGEVCFKYQLTGEDLDNLISVTNDEDIENMMNEYERLCRLSSKPARLRLFLFPIQTPTMTPSGSFGSSEQERLVEALNSVPPQASPPPPPALAAPPPPNVDFLFGTEKGVANQVQQVAPMTHEDPIQRHIQDLKRLQIVGQGEGMHRRISDDNSSAVFSGEYYTQKVSENFQTGKMAGNVAENLPGPGGMYPTTGPAPEQAMYMMSTQTGMYHVPMGRAPVTGPPNQGYYTVQPMPPEFYRDQQQQYGMVTQVGAQAIAPPGYSERFGIARPNTGGGVGMVDSSYAHVYDTGMGRPVYYNTPGGVVASQYPQYAQYPGGVVTNQEGKSAKTTQGFVSVAAPGTAQGRG